MTLSTKFSYIQLTFNASLEYPIPSIPALHILFVIDFECIVPLRVWYDSPIEQCGMHYKSGQFQGLHFVTGNPHIIIPYHARLPKLNESRPQNSDIHTVSMEKVDWKHQKQGELKGMVFFLSKLLWPTVRKICFRDQEKLLKFEAEGQEFANFWDH